MPQPYKGERRPVLVRPVDEVFAELEKLRQEAGVKSMSQYIADLLAMHVGRPELARELNQEVLQISA
ncbi:hypothetical protein A5731_13005 [Mycolicibacterium conceptionense]|uniref:hypothetical protein n=1 Tax=Mycolicibacterium TaxID=1866885 RepID=UPI0007E9F767|nr:hypothetical protein [Mycolicibacterium conceptionense]OBB14671.1 hypothetical protein A5718_30285 [Mycolicibacterium conceptionense]OBF03407.1 hypothetical protein A5731_13005 [Mycolicibacterium conceptionense]